MISQGDFNVEFNVVNCFDKATLEKAVKLAIRRKYNRCPSKDFVKSLPSGQWFPVVFTMIHEHAQGEKVAPHIRCWVQYNEEGGRFFIDCDSKLFDSLPRFMVPKMAPTASND